MSSHDSLPKAAIEAALEIGLEQGWDRLSLTDVAARAGVSLEAFYGLEDSLDLADAVDRHFDLAMSAEPCERDETARTRLFEVIMLRFDAMEPYRAALGRLRTWQRRSPVRLARRMAALRRTAGWALVAAHLDSGGPLPAGLKALPLTRILAKTEAAWRAETDAGLPRTMATLDEGLRGAEGRLRTLARMFGMGRATPDRQEARAEDPTGEAPHPASEADASEPEDRPKASPQA